MKFVATTTAYQLDLQAAVVYYAELSVRMARMMKESELRVFRTPCARLRDNRTALEQGHEVLTLWVPSHERPTARFRSNFGLLPGVAFFHPGICH